MQWIRTKACNGLGIDQDLFDACASDAEAQQDLAGFLEGGMCSFLSCINAISRDTKVYMHEVCMVPDAGTHASVLFVYMDTVTIMPARAEAR